MYLIKPMQKFPLNIQKNLIPLNVVFFVQIEVSLNNIFVDLVYEDTIVLYMQIMKHLISK